MSVCLSRKSYILLSACCGLACIVFLYHSGGLRQYTGYTSNGEVTQREDLISGIQDIRFKLVFNNSISVGLSLNSSRPYIVKGGFNTTNFVKLNDENAGEFVIVTAANDGYFHIDMDAIANVQKMLPNRTIIFYDLSVKRSETDVSKIRKLCNVIYRQFNYSRYPSHVQDLVLYAWKPLIVNEVLLEYPGVFWMDSSARFLSSNLTGFFKKSVQNGGIMTFGYSSHKIFPATHEGMYLYLPIPRDKAISVRMFDANSVYFFRTREIYNNIVRWWTSCALVRECIASISNRFCSFRGADHLFAGCHRFDQAALNILMAIHFKYDDNAYFYTSSPVTEIVRGSQGKEQLVICSPDGVPTTKSGSHKYFAQK